MATGQLASTHKTDPTRLLGPPTLLAVLIGVVVGWCLTRLAELHAVSLLWPVVLTVLLLIAAVVALVLVRVRARDVGAKAGLVVVLTFSALLLSVIGMLLRLSLGVTGSDDWSEPVIGILGLACFFGALELCLRVRPMQARPSTTLLTIAVTAVIALGLFQVFERPRVAALPAGSTSASDWSTSLLAMAALAALAAALSTDRFWRPEWYLRRRPPDLGQREMHLLRAALPTLSALALLAFTANLAVAVALLAGGLGILIRTGWLTVGTAPVPAAKHRSDQRSANATRSRRPRSPRSAAAALVLDVGGFAFGAWLIAMVGAGLGETGTDRDMAMAGRAADPIMIYYHHSFTFGPGFAYRHIGPSGAGPAILSAIGRETGFAGIAAVAVLFILLIGSLIVLGHRQIRLGQSAWTYGLAAFIGCQLVIAALRAGRVPSLNSPGPPLLAGGAAWYVVTLLALGAAVGLALRSSMTVEV